ncbi:MAG TPA: hypothetical protein VE173_02545, partial [Longimicrobiales bacterium]|nr:hypothetical protein [Longimicrobiales bacterium]
AGAVDEEAARALGARLGAGSVLMGSAVAAGPAVRLSAELLAVDGGTLARAQVQGPAADALALVDSLSMSIVREIWVAREPVPTAELSAVTTGSMEALREYLQGESWFRASLWDSAAAHFERAVAIDTAFALAHMRLSNTYGWSELQGAPRSVAAMERAWRFADRLPQRERAVLRAARLRTVDRDGPGALDSLRAYVGRYPDDVHAWELLADIQFHERVAQELGRGEVLAAFERVNQLDPHLGPALIHPLEMTLGRDSAAYRTWLERYEGAAAAADAAPYRRVERVLWAGEGRLPDLVDELVPERTSLAGRTVGAAIEVGRIPGREVLEAARRMAPFAGGRANWLGNVSHYYSALGRTALAGVAADSLERLAPGAAANVRAVGALVGLGPPLDPSSLDRLGQNRAPWGEVLPSTLRAGVALREGRLDEAERYLDEAAAVPDPTSAGAAGFVDGLRGRVLVVRGDTAGGLDLMASALAVLADGDDLATGNRHLFRLPWLAVRAAWSGGPPSAMADLEGAQVQLPQQEVLRHEALARAREARGDTSGALVEYRALLTLWDDVDPELQPRVEAVRAAVARLGG